MKSKEALLLELDTVLAKIARLESQNTSTGVEQCFHLGMVGGSGHNVQKLNQRKMEALERGIDRALQLAPLYRERERLTNLLDTYEQRAEREQRRQQQRADALERLRNVQPGQEVIVPGGNTVKVKRRNKNSITTISGSRWAFDELVDVAQKHNSV